MNGSCPTQCVQNDTSTMQIPIAKPTNTDTSLQNLLHVITDSDVSILSNVGVTSRQHTLSWSWHCDTIPTYTPVN